MRRALRALGLAALVAAAACGEEAGPPPPAPIEMRTAREGIGIVPETTTAVPIDSVPLPADLSDTAPVAWGPLRIALLEAGPWTRSLGRFHPSTDAAFFMARVRIENPGAETEVVDPSAAFVLVDAKGAARFVSAAAVALSPSPFDAAEIAPGDSIERLLVFPLVGSAAAERIEAHRGEDAALLPVRLSPGAASETATAAAAEHVLEAPRPPAADAEVAIGRVRGDAGALSVVEYVPGPREWSVHLRLEAARATEVGPAVLGLWDGEHRLAPLAHDAPARLPAGGLAVFQVRFPAPRSRIPVVEAALAGSPPLRIPLPAPAP